MKKVRFETPAKPIFISTMYESECHSPRPFILKEVNSAPRVEYLDYGPVPFTSDPVQRFESSNSLPYPLATRTCLSDSDKVENKWSPSNELDLSILDSIPNKPVYKATKHPEGHTFNSPGLHNGLKAKRLTDKTSPNVLTSVENKRFPVPPNVLRKNGEFFLRKDNLTGYHHLGSELNKLHLDKENDPLLKKNQMMIMEQSNIPLNHVQNLNFSNSSNEMDDSCRCHHCFNVCNTQQHIVQEKVEIAKSQNINRNSYNVCHCIKMQAHSHNHCACTIPIVKPFVSNCNCNNTQSPPLLKNAVDKKTRALQRYEQDRLTECLDVEKQTNITMDKTEPTVADLFKIIKLQNEQLQLLQEKVDKFISSSTHKEQKTVLPVQNYVTEQATLSSVGTEQKISIGVMTSFEVVRTSKIINKEFVKQNEAQIQCNRSQISIKEVVSKQPANLNFLDGLSPITKEFESHQTKRQNDILGDITNIGDCNEDKTLNEMSLYNVQVDNAITPNISPEQSLYLDIRDYSDSDASDDQSNVGWTYYNKVMTHVNGMLQESDMPSSASALYRNVRQKCLQMHIDKSNVSAKRVTFGDDPLVIPKAQIETATTDTSLKMKQLAAKYLKNGAMMSNTPSPRPVALPADMSLATRNYMEKHRIIKGTNVHTGQPQPDIPKFLDITALKQQPKFL